MDAYLQITSVIGVYVAGVVFVAGMALRVYQWVTTPKSPVALGMFPKPATRTGRIVKMLKDTLIAPQSAQIEPRMWLFAMAFHVAALAAFVGHLRLVQEFPILPGILGEEGMNSFAGWAGGIAGVLMMVAVLYWLARRTFGPFKQLSVPEDYLLLALLLGIIIMGNHMRFVGHVHAETYREWFQSLLLFRPVIPTEIANSNVGWSLGTHMLFVNLFLIYFPFSKLVHTIGSFSANLVRSE
ncbi:MAG TPA: respiratory nitrate reductase subunit gamma [Coriobacteriia bacterium]|nr:respiratory nitrate reductase subunit gamma [Coriobacteriia bacterium]